MRQEVFSKTVVEQTCYYLDADGYDQKALHLLQKKEGKVVAYCRIFPEGVKYPETSIGRVLTHPDFRNLKIRKTLIQFALEAIKPDLTPLNVEFLHKIILLNFTVIWVSRHREKYLKMIFHIQKWREMKSKLINELGIHVFVKGLCFLLLFRYFFLQKSILNTERF